MCNEILINFGNRLKVLRQAKGLSQEALALGIDVDRTYIGKIERAERNVSLKMVGKIAKALEVDVKDFFVV